MPYVVAAQPNTGGAVYWMLLTKSRKSRCGKIRGRKRTARRSATRRPTYTKPGSYTPCLKKRPTFDLLWVWHTWIDFDIFGGNVTDKVGNQKTHYYATSSNLCFCTTGQNGETRKSHFHSVGLCYIHNAPVRCLPERKKLSSVMCLIASNICWDSNISH